MDGNIFQQLAGQPSPPPAASPETPPATTPAPPTGGNVFEQLASGNDPGTQTTQSADQEPILDRIVHGAGESLYNNIVKPVEAAALFTPPQDSAEHIIQTTVGDPALNTYRAAKSLVKSAAGIMKATGDAYPQAVNDFQDAYQSLKSGHLRDAAVSGAEGVSGALPLGGGSQYRDVFEGMRSGQDLATPLARHATDAATVLLPGAAEKAAEYSPRSVNYLGEVEGKARPANLAQGAMNKSVSATSRDVRFGDPAKALIDENITAPDSISRQSAAIKRSNELKPQLNAALDAAKGRISLHSVVTPILDLFLKELDDAAMTPEERQAANDEVSVAEERISRDADENGTLSARDANDAKQRIGDRVADWEKRPAGTPDLVSQTYHRLYGALKEAVNKVAGTEELNERLSNLNALKKSLAERNDVALKRGSLGTGSIAQNGMLQRAEAAIGHVAPAVIKGTQVVTKAAKTVAPAAAVAGQQTGLGRIVFTASDGSTHSIPDDAELLKQAQAVDPGLKVH